MLDARLRQTLASALAPLPGPDGGVAVVLAAGAVAPTMSLLSTGDVLLRESEVTAAVWTGSSAATAVASGGGFSLLVPVVAGAIRVEVAQATARPGGALTALGGAITRLRMTSEPPWTPELRFALLNGDAANAGAFVKFWASVHAWLADGAVPPSPRVPTT